MNSSNKFRLIAELCQNHLGDSTTLFEMVRAAKMAGATHAKIQALYSDELSFRAQFEDGSGEARGLVRPYSAEKNRLSKLDLSENVEREFVEVCASQGITPMITVFSHAGLERAVRVGFRSLKIASYDCASIPLIQSSLLVADELIVSTGATAWRDVAATAQFLGASAKENQFVALLHARTLYPTPMHEAGLSRLSALKVFGLPVGLSDHSQPEKDAVDMSKFSIWLGASLVERHFSILDVDATRDGPVSVNAVQLREIAQFAQLDYIDQTKIAARILEKYPEILCATGLEPNSEESKNAHYYRGRVGSWKGDRQVFSWESWA